ncbi:uncharacterized protein TNCV_2763861 [Trichonephila clavipes]|nr:uncharacterized protein TNCV_2763861 [Trichonephila clavipes]
MVAIEPEFHVQSSGQTMLYPSNQERCRGRWSVMPWSPRRHPWPPEERGPSSTRRPPQTNMIWNTPNWPLLLLLLAYVRVPWPTVLDYGGNDPWSEPE